MNNFFRKTKAGVSLLIAIVLISLVMLFAMGISSAVISGLRNTANVNRSNEAFYAAEGALEWGLIASQDKSAGFTGTATDLLHCSPACPATSASIQGTVPPSSVISNNYVIPTPGTGTAGSNCNPLTAVTLPFNYSDAGYPVSDASPFDHPCNWNKLKVGESVTIPLYVSVMSPNPCIKTMPPTPPDNSVPNFYVCNPTDLGLTNLNIKIRTPCKTGADMCRAINRYTLNTTPSGSNAPYGGDDPIVSWQITGTDQTGTTTYTLQPNVGTEYNSVSKIWSAKSTAIYKSLINSPAVKLDGNFVVLKESGTKWASDLLGGKGTIINFLTNYTNLPLENNNWNTRQIYKPILKLSVVHGLEASTMVNIPYLEYQITTNSNLKNAPADTSQTIHAEGVSGTFKQVLEVKEPQESGLLQYVIQQ